MVEVRPRLLLGSMDDMLVLVNRPKLRSRRLPVTHLLSLLNKPLDWSEINSPLGPLTAKCVLVSDTPDSDLLSHFDACIRFIKQGMDEGTVLVHCQHGISRSATIVLAFLMQTEEISFRQAIDDLMLKKPSIKPNSGFLDQLLMWQKMKYKIDMNFKPYKAYTLRHQARHMKESGYVDSMSMAPDPLSQHHAYQDLQVSYRCRKCRRVLFASDNVLQHELGERETTLHEQNHLLKCVDISGDTIDNDTMKATKCSDEDIQAKADENKDSSQTMSGEQHPSCSISTMASEQARMRALVAKVVVKNSVTSNYPNCSSLFTEAVEWMGPLLLGNKEGKLFCPKCASRLGSFDWAGIQCSCGKWVTPAFQFHKTKLDIT